MTRFAGEKLDAAGFEKEFGLKSVAENEAYSKGSTTGTKQVGALGTYMTEDDYNRLRNDDKVRDAYASLHGQEAMESKFGDDGISINTLDALFDDLSAGKPAGAGDAAPTEPEPIIYSDKTAKAKAGVAAYDKVIRPYQGDYIMGRKTTNPSDDFMAEYDLQLDNYRQPRDPNEIDGGIFVPSPPEVEVIDFDADQYFSGQRGKPHNQRGFCNPLPCS